MQLNDLAKEGGENIVREAWVAAFIERSGRAPRVLQIGNIANNAYANAKLLNEQGIDCDVICYDYYHIMGCPEWEDAEIHVVPKDQFRPFWGEALTDFKRPRWFAQGPVELCIEYLLARRTGQHTRAAILWRRLAVENGTAFALGSVHMRTPPWLQSWRFRIRASAAFQHATAAANSPHPFQRLWKKVSSVVAGPAPLQKTVAAAAFVVLAPLVLAAKLVIRPRIQRLRSVPAWRGRVAGLLRTFASEFPQRTDQLLEEDVEVYGSLSAKWVRLLEQYDVVQAYATDPIIPLLAGKRPYVAFEHGTLRDFALADNAVSRLTSLAYNQADHVFITNGDCLEYARRIRVKSVSPMLHPVDERKIRSIEGAGDEFRRKFGVRYVFLCTLRHDWAVKGTDQYIRALPAIAAAIGDDFKVLMTRWGAQLEDSRRLAAELAVSSKIEWIDPLPKRALVRAQKSVDIVFDQIALPHFGATAPEAIAAEVPVIMSYDPASTAWLVEEPAPILSAWNIEEIVTAVRMALSPEWVVHYKARAAAWIDRCHSSSIVVDRHMKVYEELLRPRIAGAKQTERGIS